MGLNSKSNNQKGFSFIELIIIVLVMSIIAVASIPQVSRHLRAYNLETVSSVIADRLLETRLTAVKHNRPAWLSIDKAAGKINVYTTNNANESIQKGVTVGIPRDVILDAATPTTVTFNSLGRNQANSEILLKFKTSDQRLCRLVVISAVGKTTTAAC